MTGRFEQEKNILDMCKKAKFSRRKVQKISWVFDPLRLDWSLSVYLDFVYGPCEFRMCNFLHFFQNFMTFW